MTAPEATSAPFIFNLFGPLQLLVDGQPFPRLRSRKGIWLLALLTLRHNRPVERDWLAGTLWPDMDQSQAFANMRPVLSELRNGLGNQKERLQSPSRQTLLLNLTGAEVDVLAFDAAIKSGKSTELEQAVALYRGPLLEGCVEEWVFQERNVREQGCLQALQKLGDAALTNGDYEAAVGYYRRAVGIDPWQESARRGWMEALAKSGDRNAALQVYREFVETLRDDPNASPDEQTTALYQRLRAEAHTQNRSHAVVVKERFVAPKIEGYLPHPVTDLIGREDECLELSSRLRRSRLLTLTGLGGIGKTRLALKVAREVAGEYADGVWLVALDALAEGKQVVPQIALALGLKEEGGRPLLDSLNQHLKSKRLLLVVDNCEHLLEAVSHVVSSLLRECGMVRILATSREALGITGETAWAVPSLAVPEPEHLPKAHATLQRVLMGYESVQLFVERAQAVQQSFAITGENALTVAQICSQLEGIPLAIEFAAARVKALTVMQIKARLDDYLDLLTSRSRATPSRQQTLRATLDWSYALLSEGERLLLRRLSVFAGGWSLEAAEGVCVGEGIEARQVSDLLTSLADKSLITFEEIEAVGRYHLLEMVRQYAAERLSASDEAERVRDRHLAWFTALAEEAEPELKGIEQAAWLRRLDTEYDNLRAALARSGTEAQAAERGLRLTGALWWFWKIRGRFSEGRQYLDAALERTPDETEARTKALNGAGALAMNQGDYAVARAYHEESLVLCRKLGDRRGMASALNNLGNAAGHQGDRAEAHSFYRQSLDIFRDLEDKRGIAMALGNLAGQIRQTGDYASSQALDEEGLKIRRSLGDEQGVAMALANLGNVARLQGDYASARARLEESLDIRRALNDKAGVAYSLSYLGALAADLGDYTSAGALLEESLTIRRELGEKRSIAWSLNNLGLAALYEGRFPKAHTLLEESLGIFRELGNRVDIAWSLEHLGDAAQLSGDNVTARRRFVESLEMFRELEDKEGVAKNLRDLAVVLASQGAGDMAARLWGAAEALRESIGAALSRAEEENHFRRIEQVRMALGEEVFAVAWSEGHALNWEQAVEFALSEGLRAV